MIPTLLLAHPWLSVAALLCLVVAGLVLGPWLVGRPALAGSLAVLAAVPLVVLTLTPVGVLVHRGCSLHWALPFGRAEPLANVLLFVAPVFLAALALRRPWVVLIGASVLSAGIEATQAFMPGRACDTGDWLNNTLGAAVGAGLAAVVLRYGRRRALRERVGAAARPVGRSH